MFKGNSMLATELPTQWHAELWSRQETSAIWRLAPTQQPDLNEINCNALRIAEGLHGCEVSGSYWLMQEIDGVYWLTEFRASSPVADVVLNDWRGRKIQQFTTQGRQLTIYQNRHHPRQLESFIAFRQQSRNPTFRELSHGRFYLSLQRPVEDIFIFVREQGCLLVSIRLV